MIAVATRRFTLCLHVQEIISTGGTIPPPFPGSDVPVGVHLPPADFHSALLEADPAQSVLIDVRCSKEFQIGHFERSIDPKIRTFAEWPKFVKDNMETLKGKKVFMYCTGGIRCEKASAYMKSAGFDEVYQLKGGIHRYLEAVRAVVLGCCARVAPNGFYRSVCVWWCVVCVPSAVRGWRPVQGQELCV